MNKRPGLPKGIQITEDGRIIYSWQRFNGRVLVLLILDLWLVWLIATGIQRDIDQGNLGYTVIFCLSPLLISSYYILAMLLNRTEFWVEGNELFIQHKPLPWFGNRAIPLAEIKGFTVEEDRLQRGSKYYHLLVDIRDKPGSKSFPMLSRTFVDLTNETRGNVAFALRQQLIITVQKYTSATGPITNP